MKSRTLKKAGRLVRLGLPSVMYGWERTWRKLERPEWCFWDCEEAGKNFHRIGLRRSIIASILWVGQPGDFFWRNWCWIWRLSLGSSHLEEIDSLEKLWCLGWAAARKQIGKTAWDMQQAQSNILDWQV